MAEMEFRIPIIADTANSYPALPLICISNGETITFSLAAPERSVSIKYVDLAAFVRVMAAMATEEK